MRKYYLVLFIGIFPLLLSAQWLNGIATSWNDSFREWIVFAEEEEEIEGKLELRWKLQDNWREWEYDVNGERGSIKMTFQNNPGQWEIRGGGEVITARTRWANDLTEWRITNNSTTFYFKSRWRNNFNEWLLTSKDHGDFQMYTEWENDPREWRIVDEMDEDTSLPVKMAMVFLAIYNSTPKE